MSEKDKKIEKTVPTRIFQAGTGLGIVRGNIVPLTSAIFGRAALWHGTPLKNMFLNEVSKGIFEEGVTTRFAGANKRLNNILLQNSFMREAESFLKKKGIKVTPEIESKLYDATKGLMEKYTILSSKLDSSPRGIKTKINNLHLQKPLPEYVLESSETMAKKIGVNPSEFKSYIEKKLPEFGKRSYFATHPSSVAFWAKEGKNELHFLRDKMMKGIIDENVFKENVKTITEALADQTTGGYYSQAKERLAYGSGKKTKVNTLNEAKKILENYKKSGKNFDVSFRASIPTRSMQHMKDFPGIRHVVGSSPGLKTMLARYIPSADPSKDLSIIEKVKPKYIDRFHIVNPETGKLMEEIRIKNAEKQGLKFLGGKGHRLINLKKSIIPLALTGIGGEMIYNAITGKSFTDLFKKDLVIDKKAYVDPKKAIKAFGYPAAFLGSTGLGFLGASKALNLKMEEPLTEEEFEKLPLSEKIKYQAREYNYLKKAVPLAQTSGTALGSILGAIIAKNKRGVGALLGGALAGQLAGGLAPSIPLKAKLIKQDPEHAGLLIGPVSRLSETIKKKIKENPEVASIGETVGVTSLGVGLPYVAAKKYYPVHALDIKKWVDRMKEATKGFLSDDVVKAAIKPVRNKLALGLALPPILSYAIYQAMESGVKGAGKLTEKIESKYVK